MITHILSPWQWKQQRNKSFTSINEKTAEQSYSYGCIMGYLDPNVINKINAEYKLDQIKESDIYDNEDNEYGLEIEPHITLLYGLHDDEIEEDEVIQLLQSLKLPTVNLTQINCFNNEQYDVLKWDAESHFLNLYNKIITLMFPYTNKFPEYHAHCTIAYLQPGAGERYNQLLDNNLEVQIINWVYSKADGKKISINSEGIINIIRESETT